MNSDGDVPSQPHTEGDQVQILFEGSLRIGTVIRCNNARTQVRFLLAGHELIRWFDNDQLL